MTDWPHFFALEIIRNIRDKIRDFRQSHPQAKSGQKTQILLKSARAMKIGTHILVFKKGPERQKRYIFNNPSACQLKSGENRPRNIKNLEKPTLYIHRVEVHY